jgi:CobQ-like glutamine amidotransferase family enzyme
MNLYGDRGNIFCLRHRCSARGIDLDVVEIGLGDDLDPNSYDLIFMGGGQDREQRRIGADLLDTKAGPIHRAVGAGMPVLTVCGGYQMMGRSYQPAEGARLPGLAIFNMETVHPGDHAPRCIGNIEVEWEHGDLVGFENHGGRTYLDNSCVPLGRVAAGFGNNGEDGTEGCRWQNAFGTYLHGSLLPKNPQLADLMIGIAATRKYGAADLEPLDDSLEDSAHAAAVQIARAQAKQRTGGLAAKTAGLLEIAGKRLRSRGA